MVERINKRLAIRVARAYRTVSTEAIFVVAGMPPLELVAMEKTDRTEGVDIVTAKQNLKACWQDKRENCYPSWTKRVILDIGMWVDRGHGELRHTETV